MGLGKSLKKIGNVAKKVSGVDMIGSLGKIGRDGGASGDLQRAYDIFANLQDPTAIEDSLSTLDPTGRAALVKALQQMQGIAEAGGLTAEDRQGIADINQRVGQNIKGQLGAIRQNAAARGIGGSGFELSAALGAGQQQAETAGRQAIDVAALARQRALQAIQQTGQLGGSLNQSDMEKAEAQNRIKQFNADMINNFRLQKAAGMTGQLSNMAENKANRQRSKDAFKGGVIGTIGNIIGGAAKAGGK